MEASEPLYVLKLGGKDISLCRIEEGRLERVPLPDLPNNMEEALNYDEGERGAQAHSASNILRGKQGAVFHGQGGIPERAKQDLESFLRVVNRCVTDHLRGDETPLVLACVDYVATIYRNVNTYPHLLSETLSGNAANQRSDQVVQRVRPLLESRRAERWVSISTSGFPTSA